MAKSGKKYILSDSSVNTYGFRMLTSGYQMPEFQKNPIGYLMHKRDDGVAVKWHDLAIEGDNVVGYPEVNMSYPGGARIADEVENGFLNAASVGHIVVLEHSMSPSLMLPGQTGPTITKWYNKECSLVDIPGNCNALTNLYDTDHNVIGELQDGTMVLFSDNQNIINMDKYSAEFLATLGLKAGASDAEVTVATMNLATKNNTLELQLKAQKDDATAKDVAEQLSAALKDKKITAEFRVVLAEQYAGRPGELKTMLAALPSFVSVNDQLSAREVSRDGDASYKPEAMALMKLGWDNLDKGVGGTLKQLKAADETAYLALYKQKYGYEPNGKPKPAFVDRDIANRK